MGIGRTGSGIPQGNISFEQKEITPHDTNNITDNQGNEQLCVLHVDAAGDIKYDDSKGNTATITVAASTLIDWVFIKRLYATDTTATGFVAYF